MVATRAAVVTVMAMMVAMEAVIKETAIHEALMVDTDPAEVDMSIKMLVDTGDVAVVLAAAAAVAAATMVADLGVTVTTGDSQT